MPVSGFKLGDKVLSPAGRPGVVVGIGTHGPSVAIVRFKNGKQRQFRQAALRRDYTEQ